MRRAERPCGHQALVRRHGPGNGMDLCGLQGFFERHIRQDSGNALGQHGFSGPRRADHQNVGDTIQQLNMN